MRSEIPVIIQSSKETSPEVKTLGLDLTPPCGPQYDDRWRKHLGCGITLLIRERPSDMACLERITFLTKEGARELARQLLEATE